MVRHLWPVGLGVPEKDDIAGHIDAHVSQLRTKRADGRGVLGQLPARVTDGDPAGTQTGEAGAMGSQPSNMSRSWAKKARTGL
ncbi:hypothetical protein GCM10009863_53550 [Streptomyces axinellae]|uniref:Uncharacterized protein n=1 Tax=Streptomyces axinellae TaxID=552788 RepID=A0ABN3QNM2_9ACTN